VCGQPGGPGIAKGGVAVRRALAIDILLWSAKVSDQKRNEMTAEFNSYDVLYLPTNDATGTHWLLLRAVRPLRGSLGASWTLERYSLGGGGDDNDDTVRRFLSGCKIQCGGGIPWVFG
jgi:hypothetical protein